ncbi:MAG: hypothetical protein ACI93N_001030 [Flavobacteriaceae bacterium]|jgi:hypothetical protein
MKKLTDITIILDRSGSMDVIKDATIEGFNSFLKKQKSGEFDTNLTFVQFDDEYQMLYEEKDIKSVKYLNSKSFQPRGTTSLLDAIGATINLTKHRLNNKSKLKHPKGVIVAIITDGYENSSTKFPYNKVFKMIRKRELKDGWNFVFLGANQDAIKEGKKFGINPDRALSFDCSENGVKNVFHSMSNVFFDCPSSNSQIKFSDEDRKGQKSQ